MKLSEHFTLHELSRSSTANRLGIKNEVPKNVIPHLELLCQKLLEPLRKAWGSPIVCSSGYRCQRLNSALNGSKTSAHMVGYAADLYPQNGKMEEFKAFVRKWLKESGVAYDQYINEFSDHSQWVHLAVKSPGGAQRRQNLLYRNGKYSYLS